MSKLEEQATATVRCAPPCVFRHGVCRSPALWFLVLQVKSLDFEVKGKVQGLRPMRVHRVPASAHRVVPGVFFRKHTRINAIKRKLTGWVMNTAHGSKCFVHVAVLGRTSPHSLGVTAVVASGTVVGQLFGAPRQVDSMKVWLSEVGSPKSRIDGASFTNERSVALADVRYKKFSIRRSSFPWCSSKQNT